MSAVGCATPTARLGLARQALADGQPVLLLDDSSAHPFGLLVVAGECVEPESVAFVIRCSAGFVCAAMPASRCDALGIPMMNGTDPDGRSDFAVTIDAKDGVTTGISAADRARTIRLLATPLATRSDFVRPGVVPVRVDDAAVGQPRSPAAAALGLVVAAGLEPVAAYANLVSERDLVDMPDRLEMIAFARRHELVWVRAADLPRREPPGERALTLGNSQRITTPYGRFLVREFRDPQTGRDHLVLTNGYSSARRRSIVRVHIACSAADVFGARWCGCAADLDKALRQLGAGGGTLIYLTGLPAHDRVRVASPPVQALVRRIALAGD